MRFLRGGVSAAVGLLLVLTTLVPPTRALPRHPSRGVGVVEVRANTPPAYTGPKDDENVPTFEGIMEFAIQNWPEGLDEDYDMAFWTGMATDIAMMTKFIESRPKKTIWFDDVFPFEPQTTTAKIIWDMTRVADAALFMKFARPSGVYAKLARGTVYVLVPASVKDIMDPYPGPQREPTEARDPDKHGRAANFSVFELPLLTRNAQVTSVVRVDADNFDHQTVIWTQGDAPMGAEPDFDDYTPPRWPSMGAGASNQLPDDDGDNDVPA